MLGFIGLQGDYIAGCFVDSSFQSRGIGHQLLMKAKESSDHLTVHVYKQNQRAVSFYEKEGFVVVSEKVQESTGQPEFVMRWQKEKAG